jgi:hypothetical protein
MALLHAQRGEAARLAREERGSQQWIDSSNRLDDLNDRIMHDDLFDPLTEERRDESAAPSRRTD